MAEKASKQAQNQHAGALRRHAALEERQLGHQPVQVQGEVYLPHLVQRAELDPGSLAPAEVTHLQQTIGNRAVGRLLGRAAQASLQRAPDPSASVSSTTTPVVQRVAAPNFKQKYSLPDAASNLATSRTDGSANGVIGMWIQYILQKLFPKAGKVKSTYVSSFDTAKGGFSASRAIPDVPALVVHAHYQRNLSAPDTAKVNSSQVKWADDEEGSPPPGQTKIPAKDLTKILGDNHDQEAIEHWNKNPDRHQLREKAKKSKEKKEKDQGPWGDDGGAPSWMEE